MSPFSPGLPVPSDRRFNLEIDLAVHVAIPDSPVASASIVRFVPTLVLQFPVSKPLLEVLRPLVTAVHRSCMISQEGAQYATGRQRYPNSDLLRQAYWELVNDFQAVIAVGSLAPGRPEIRIEAVTDALSGFVHTLTEPAQIWRGGDWPSGRIADSWGRLDWPSPAEVEEIVTILTGKGSQFGPKEAAFVALRGARGISGENLKGEESLRKLLREPTEGRRRAATMAQKKLAKRGHSRGIPKASRR